MQAPSELDHPSWVRDVTRDAVRHFAWGVGDDNPLWLDPEYAARSRYGGIVAPPCFPCAVHETTVAPGYDDRPRQYHRADWCWFDAIRLGARIAPLAKVETTESTGGGVVQTGSVTYGSAAPVARVRVACLRPETRVLPVAEPARRYTAEELADIERSVLAETRRGADPRYFEDIAVGEALGPLTKGPLSIMDIVAWCAGTTGVPAPGHEGSAGGLVDEFASGPQVSAWFAHLVGDWGGDDAFLHRLELAFHLFPGLGSTTRLSASVAEQWVAGAAHAVGLDLRAVDQDGELLASGTATLLLPSRDAGAVWLPLRDEVLRP